MQSRKAGWLLAVAMLLATGTVQANRLSGHGTETFDDGKHYEGEFRLYKPHGQGVMTWPDGARYVGEFRDGERTGRGFITVPGEGLFEGEFWDGKPGRGVATHADGEQWEFAQWTDDGLPRGRGFITNALGRMEVDILPDGSMVTLHVEPNPRSFWAAVLPPGGNGKAPSYQGEEDRNGEPHGQGVKTWGNGRQYTGEWRAGSQHGQGVLSYSDGSRYEGEWWDGYRHGHGVMTYPDGTRYEGEWRDGYRHGEGVMTEPDGARYEGEWREGVFVGG